MMNPGQLMEVNTASTQNSIWRWSVKQNKFRQNIDGLYRASNEVPVTPKIHRREEWPIRNDDVSYILPFEMEGQLADDFAFLAAAEEGTKAVSAVGLEQRIDRPGLIVRLAANEIVPKHVPGAFKNVFDILGSCASKKLSREICTERLFDIVISLSQNRLYGRLKSKHWIPPPHLVNRKREPLHEELRNLSTWIFQQRPKLRKASRDLIQRLDGLSKAYETIDSLAKDSPQSLQKLGQIVKESYAFCTSDGGKTIEETIREYGLTPSQTLTDKRIEQVNKIGRYWGLCVYVTEASRKYPKVFEKVDFEAIIPYRGLKSPISPNMVFVHAEVQLVTFYDLNPSTTTLNPRVLGTSKEACYLCNLFLLSHGRFFVTKTHGHLYPHWNIPNLAAYSQSQLRQYRHIIVMMDTEIRNALLEQRRSNRNLPFPPTSSANLPGGRQMSPLPSDAGTLISSHHANSILGSTPLATQSPAILVEHIDLETPLANSPYFDARAAPPLSATTSFEQSPSPSMIHPNVPPLTHLIPNPIPNQQPNQEPPYLSTSPSSSSSSSSSSSTTTPTPTPKTITPNPTPTHHKISPSRPIHLQSGPLSAHIELEGPGQGTVLIQRLIVPHSHSETGNAHTHAQAQALALAPGTLIDVGAILPNEPILLERAGEERELVLRLRLRWEWVVVWLRWG